MKLKAQIVNERRESFVAKRGKVEQVIFSCLDLDGTHALVNTFDYVATEEEATKLSGKAHGKRVDFGIISFEPAFGNRLRAKGEILKLE